ncbi:hypothetical protein BKA67DRAFT_568239 [Truncatella angustata]|uniref:Uncharacterized protein n=1 Tax=Truncatella angustata TaxID=152316 RepID=A0A9P8ZWF2_9PEZI|nr:uncharacterized protein BKA67DRAFT_568239 [Truncatella angustata]KAH6652981.1 hypothetical protein BKA67DRAFT_568239 [Truncatella angustata]
MNTGDDNFICEWIHWKRGFDLCIQNAPEAEITTHVWPNSNFFWQLVRWQKSSIQSYRRKLFHSPGIETMWPKHPYTTRKMFERLLRPFYMWLYFLTWAYTLGNYPILGLAFLAYFACGWHISYRAFVKQYPYCRRKVWAAWLMDYCYAIVDVYAWLTLNQEGWLTRDDKPSADLKKS